jgi:hypothetical protein
MMESSNEAAAWITHMLDSICSGASTADPLGKG